MDQPANVDSLRDKFHRHADRSVWAKALAKDKTRRKLFQPNPL